MGTTNTTNSSTRMKLVNIKICRKYYARRTILLVDSSSWRTLRLRPNHLLSFECSAMTYLSYITVLPWPIKTWKNERITSAEIKEVSAKSSKVQLRPRYRKAVRSKSGIGAQFIFLTDPIRAEIFQRLCTTTCSNDQQALQSIYEVPGTGDGIASEISCCAGQGGQCICRTTTMSME